MMRHQERTVVVFIPGIAPAQFRRFFTDFYNIVKVVQFYVKPEDEQ